MDAPLKALLNTHTTLFVRQEKEWTEILTDFETSNKYTILTPSQEQIGFVVEKSLGFLSLILRLTLRSHRPLEVYIMDGDTNILMYFTRPFFWFFSLLTVKDAQGHTIGAVQRRFGFFNKVYDLLDKNGTPFARIESNLFRLWSFPLVVNGIEKGGVFKKWGGALKEMFTRADTFQIDFAAHPWTDEQRAIILSSAISIDFDFFEQSRN